MASHVGADPCDRFALVEAASRHDLVVWREELRAVVLFRVGSHPVRGIVDEIPNLFGIGVDEYFGSLRHQHGYTSASFGATRDRRNANEAEQCLYSLHKTAKIACILLYKKNGRFVIPAHKHLKSESI